MFMISIDVDASGSARARPPQYIESSLAKSISASLILLATNSLKIVRVSGGGAGAVLDGPRHSIPKQV
jgi:hypothetical protein